MEVKTPAELAEAGKSAYQNGDFLAAAQAFEAAVRGYKVQDDELMAAEMANNQSVASLQAGDAQAALDAVAGTDAIFEAAGDTLRQAMAVGNYAAALEELDRLDEAEEAYRQSADLLKQIGEHDLRGQVMQSISALQLRTGRQLEALATMQAGVTDLERPNLRQRLLKKVLDIPFKFLNRSKS